MSVALKEDYMVPLFHELTDTDQTEAVKMVSALCYLVWQAWANSINPDQILLNVASDQGLHCL